MPLAHNPLITYGQNPRTVGCDGDGVFKVGGQLAVSGHNRPFVAQNTGVMCALVYHWFDGNCHSRQKLDASAARAVVGHAWVLVKFRTYAVADVISYHRVTTSFDILLNRTADVADTVQHLRLLNSLIQAFSGGVEQPLRFFADAAAGISVGVVAVIPLVVSPNVNADDVAVPENGVFAWYAMDNHVVYGNACTCGKAAVTEKRGGCPLFLDIRTDNCINFKGGDTGLNRLSRNTQRLSRNSAGVFHQRKLPRCFD